MISDLLAAELLTATVTSLWVGAVLVLSIVLLTRCFAFTPQSRYRLWALALAISITAPLARVFPAGGPEPEASSSMDGVTSLVEGALPGPGPEPSAIVEEGMPAPPFLPSAPAVGQTLALDTTIARIMLWGWIAGAITGLAWLGFQVFLLVALKRSARPPGDRLSRIWEKTISPLGGRRNVRLLLSHRSRLPAACGYFQPAIVAPDALCRALNEEETRHLLLHELAHLARYDDWGLLAHRFVQSVCWWHPVVWFIGKRLDIERELACDEAVVKASGRRLYARTLVRIAEVARGNMIELAPGVLRGKLTRRVEALLRIAPTPRRLAVRTGAGAAALSLVALGFWISPPQVRLSFDAVTGQAQQRANAGPAIAHALDSMFTGYADSGFSGSILLAMNGDVVLSQGYGMADRERGIPATAETRYSVAGFTKMFTAVAVLALESEGRLRVTDSLERFFGPLAGTDGQVTLHQLLTHTDGLTRQNAPVYRADPRAFVRAVSASPDSFSPGQGYRYNDFGHSVLGVVVEMVTGTSYESFVRDRFLRPAGLSHTGFENDAAADFAVEYAGAPGHQYPIPPRSYTWGRRASLGMVSTVGDMYRWVKALDDPRVVPPRVKERMFQTHGVTDWNAERGYGWDRVRRRDGSYLWRRVAGTPGMEGEILHDPVKGWTAVILVNSRVEWRFRVWDDIADAVERGTSGSEPQ